MKWRKTVRLVLGTVLILLGLLWILQGADVVRMRPILCVADCQPITGGSAAWLATGAVTVIVGLGLVVVHATTRSLRRRSVHDANDEDA